MGVDVLRRKAHFWLYYTNSNDFKEFYEKFKDEILDFKVSSSFFDFRMYQDGKGYDYIMKQIKSLGLRYSYWEAREYTKAEIKNAEFFWLNFIYPWEHDSNYNAEKYGTKYSREDICPACGRGKKQISELIVDLKKVIKYKVATINPEIMVSTEVREQIEKNGLSGVSFDEVRDYKNREMPIYHQMFIHNILPPMSNKIRVEIEDVSHCKVCNRGGIYLRSEAIYERKDLGNTKDFNLTNEFFWSANYCVSDIIASTRARDVLNNCKVRFGYEPVEII